MMPRSHAHDSVRPMGATLFPKSQTQHQVCPCIIALGPQEPREGQKLKLIRGAIESSLDDVDDSINSTNYHRAYMRWKHRMATKKMKAMKPELVDALGLP